jgi:hypothetical protein
MTNGATKKADNRVRDAARRLAGVEPIPEEPLQLDERGLRLNRAFRAGTEAGRGEWMLLNATEEELREIAAEYPEQQVKRLATYVYQAREVARALQEYRRTRSQKDAVKAEHRVNRLMETLHDGGWWPMLAIDKDAAGVAWRFSTRFHGRMSKHDLFDDASWPVVTAFIEVTGNKLYECEYCGRIGPAERSDKRYCNGTCRSLASRKRRNV